MLLDQKSTTPVDYVVLFVQFFLSFLQWWYVEIPLSLLRLLKRTIVVLNDWTSLSVVVRGFFRPWHNDNNIAGWMVGITIKLFYIPVALFITLLAAAIVLVLIVIQLVILPMIIAMILLNPFLKP